MRVTTARSPSTCFNPHPARRPSATLYVRMKERRALVSILTRPEGRVRRDSAEVTYKVGIVSILTRPEGRVRRPHHPRPRRRRRVSILTRPEGRVRRLLPPATEAPQVFQSSPGPKAE